MATQLKNFRRELRDRLLDIAWRQWTTAGVAGRAEPWSGSVIDPEALLLFSCTIARHDPRLFDAIQEWLRVNGQFINVQRLKRIVREESFSGESVLRAMAAVTRDSNNQAKWAQVINETPRAEEKTEPLFYLESGDPLPVVREPDTQYAEYGFSRDRFDERGVAGPFRPEVAANLILRLRALLGVNARCEVFEYLLVNRTGSPRAMASDCYFFPATISKTMAEMERSGFLISRTEGRRRLYSLTPETWEQLFFPSGERPEWIVWPRVFSALDQIWVFLNDSELYSRTAIEQASSLRRLLTGGVITKLERGRPGYVFGDIQAHPGEELIPLFVDRLRAFLRM